MHEYQSDFEHQRQEYQHRLQAQSKTIECQNEELLRRQELVDELRVDH